MPRLAFFLSCFYRHQAENTKLHHTSRSKTPPLPTTGYGSWWEPHTLSPQLVLDYIHTSALSRKQR